MAERIVDLLEAVHVQQEERSRLLLALAGQDGLLQAVAQEGSVGEPGQQVIVGAVLEGFGLSLARRDVAQGRDVKRSALQLDPAQETLQRKGGPVRAPADRFLRRGRSMLSRGPKPAAQRAGEFGLL